MEVLPLAVWKSIILALLSVHSSVFGTVFPSLSPSLQPPVALDFRLIAVWILPCSALFFPALGSFFLSTALLGIPAEQPLVHWSAWDTRETLTKLTVLWSQREVGSLALSLSSGAVPLPAKSIQNGIGSCGPAGAFLVS